MAMTDLWTYRDQALADVDLTGFSVEGLDGSIGKVDEASFRDGASYLVVDTGPWIFGKKVMLPAGIIEDVDTMNERVFVSRTKSDIKNAPEFDEDTYRDEVYRGRLGSYYGERSEVLDR
jgi:hypothetical protein